jgi:predicted RNA-binding protein with PUA domain
MTDSFFVNWVGEPQLYRNEICSLGDSQHISQKVKVTQPAELRIAGSQPYDGRKMTGVLDRT